jgi:hypothetical protein
MDVLIWAVECFALLCIFTGLMALAMREPTGHHHYCFAGRTRIWLRGDNHCPICGRY